MPSSAAMRSATAKPPAVRLPRNLRFGLCLHLNLNLNLRLASALRRAARRSARLLRRSPRSARRWARSRPQHQDRVQDAGRNAGTSTLALSVSMTIVSPWPTESPFFLTHSPSFPSAHIETQFGHGDEFCHWCSPRVRNQGAGVRSQGANHSTCPLIPYFLVSLFPTSGTSRP